MPLFRGKSKEAFGKNVSTEMDAGKPQKQSLAIAYAMQKKRGEQKMAHGGMITDNYESTCTEHCEQPCMIHEQASGYDNDPPEQHYADGGMVDRIMKKRMMSEGGVVANEGEDDLNKMPDGDPNEFDDLVLDDHLESTNSGAADGDALGDAQEDEDRKDMVSRIMRSRAKKDRMPRPA